MDSPHLVKTLSQVNDGAMKASVEVKRYVNLLYNYAKRKEDRDAILKFNDSGEFRWHLFSKN